MKMRCLIVLLLCLSATFAHAADNGGVEIMTYPRDATPSNTGKRFVVPDPDAHEGNAQAGLLDGSQPGWVIGSFYGYARPAGVYEITWRVKVKSNDSDKVVFKAATYDETGRSKFKGGSIEVKGKDFKAANAYQEFTYTAEKNEGGFFGVSSTWGGFTDVNVDWCRIRSVRLFTEKELIERTGPLDLPPVWRFPPSTPLRMHVAKGLWWDMFQINETLAWRRGGSMQSSYLDHGQYGSSLRGFPGSASVMTQHNVILLANVDAPALGVRGRMLLEEYVKQGGSLLIFGGHFAFTAGDYRNTALERLLPCTFDAKDRQSDRAGLAIAPTEVGKKRLPAVAWEMKPRVFYYHQVTPREGAEVWVTAGDKPLLLSWSVGKGRVACWTGSVEGDPGTDKMAFWEWGGLPPILDATLSWLVAEQGRKAEPFDQDVDGKTIDRLVTVSLEKDADAQAIAIVEQLVSKCNSADFAKKLIAGLASADAVIDRASANRLAACVRPFVDAEWTALGKQMVATGRPGKVALGLRLLGFARGEGAGAEFPKYLRELAGTTSMDAMNDPSQIGNAERILVGAVQGAGDLGDVKNLAMVTQIGKGLSKQLPADGDMSATGDMREEAYQHTILSRLKLGDESAAVQLVEVVLKNILLIEQYRNYQDMMLVTKDDVAAIQGKRRAETKLPVLYERHNALLAGVSDVPVGAIAPLAAALAERHDALFLPFAFAAFSPRAGRVLDEPALRGALLLVEKSTVPQMKLMGVRMLQTSESPAAAKMLADALGKLAGSEKALDAAFAIRVSATLDAGQRAAVLDAASKHPSAEVQRLVKLSRGK